MAEYKEPSFLPEGYCLWIMPEQAFHSEVAQIIESLSRKYDTPVFQPHLTLMGVWQGQVEIARKYAEQIAGEFAPFEIRCVDIGFSERYYQNLFVKLEKTPALMAVHLRCAEIFALPASNSYMPHVSLLYGSLTSEIQSQLKASLDSKFQGKTFSAAGLLLCKVGSKISDWRFIQQFDFRGK